MCADAEVLPLYVIDIILRSTMQIFWYQTLIKLISIGVNLFRFVRQSFAVSLGKNTRKFTEWLQQRAGHRICGNQVGNLLRHITQRDRRRRIALGESRLQQFDLLIHLDETRALEPLERESLWETGEVPETYPSAL